MDTEKIEKEFWWEIKSFYERGATREDLLHLLYYIYHQGVVDNITESYDDED